MTDNQPELTVEDRMKLMELALGQEAGGGRNWAARYRQMVDLILTYEPSAKPDAQRKKQ